MSAGPTFPGAAASVVRLKGVQVRLEAKDAAVALVASPVEVEPGEYLHVSDPGRMKVQQLLHPKPLAVFALRTGRAGGRARVSEPALAGSLLPAGAELTLQVSLLSSR